MCPPGAYCPEESWFPILCSQGTFRPLPGGYDAGPVDFSQSSSIAGCYSCLPGFQCLKRGTKIPSLCKAGYYCPTGAVSEKSCRPGTYCPAGSGAEIECPRAYYCQGRSDVYVKCPFGTYCPAGSPSPTPCPSGYYGSGAIDNYDLESGCKACGRGLFSLESEPNQCQDCTPGYVCLGATSSRTPMTIEDNNGYPCPLGHYCPLGSYEEKPCPPAQYAKYLGTKSLDGCIPCKENFYNDIPG